MAAPVIESYALSDSGGAAVSSFDVALASGIVSGDLLVCVLVDEATNSAVNLWNDPAGWTYAGGSGDNTSDSWVNIYYRVADGTEGSTQTFTRTSSNEVVAWCFRISGYDSTTPINAIGNGTTGSGTSLASESIATTVADCLVFTAFSTDGADTVPLTISGTGWSKHTEIASGNSGTDVAGVVATKVQASAGSVGTCTVTMAVPDGIASLQFAIAPSGGSGAQTITGSAHTNTDTTGAGTVSQPFVHVGSNTGSSSGQVIRSIPAGHQADDICFLYIVDGGLDSPRTAPDGFQFIAELATGNDPLALADRRLSVWWKRLTSSNEPDIVIADTGQSQFVVCEVWRGCKTTGTPYQILSDDNSGTGATVTLGGGTTLSDGAPVLFGVATEIDAIGSQISSTWANADLNGLTESQNFQSAGDTGWSIYTGYGFAGAAGPVGSTTVTFNQSSDWVGVALALLDESAPTEQTIVGSAHSDPDTIGSGTVAQPNPYTAPLSEIDGDDYLTIAAEQFADSTDFTLAVYADFNNTSSATYVFHVWGRHEVRLFSTSSNQLNVQLRDTANVLLVDWTSDPILPMSAPALIYIHADTSATPSITVSIDGVAHPGNVNTLTAGTMDHTRSEYGIFARRDGTGAAPGELVGYIYIADHYEPVSSFWDGSQVLAPPTNGEIVYTSADNFAANQGTGGSFTRNGTFPHAAAARDITGAAHADPDAIGSGSVSTSYDIAGADHVDPDTIGAGTVTAGPVTITGAVFADGDVIGTGSVSPGPVTITGTLNADADSFGGGVLSQILSGAGHVDPDSFGAGTATPGAVNVAGVAHSDPDTIGSGTVTQDGGPQFITGSDHADGDAFGAGTVTPGPVGIAGSSHTDADSFGSGVVSLGGVAIIGSVHVDADQIGSGSIQPGGVTLTGTLYVDPDQFGAGAVSQGGGTQAITGATFADADMFGSGAVQPGQVNIVGGQHIDLDTFGAGLVAAGAVQITGLSLSDPDTIGSGALTPGPVVIAGNIHVDLDQFGLGSITGGLLGHAVPVHLSAGSRSTVAASHAASVLANSRITSTLGD